MYQSNADHISVTELVSAAKRGDERAWEMLVNRYQPLIRSVARRFRLSGPDAEDVGQTVWLHIVKKLDQS